MTNRLGVRGVTRRAILGAGAMLAGVPFRTAHASPRQAQPSLTGQVIWPNDPAYAEARLSFNARFSRFPAAIVICNQASDVQHAVQWARARELPIRARSGGHSYEGYCVADGALVVDLSGLRRVTVDPARGEAVVGAGVRLLDLYRQLGAHGVSLPAGTCGGVGIAGLTLGGGIGFLSRQYGLTCDNLVAVEMVDADGRLLRATAEEDADLFWALRGGGGGNFGIVTSFTFRVHPVGDVSLFSVNWPWEDVAEVIDAWQHWAPKTDKRLSVGLGVPRPGNGRINITGIFTGPAAELAGLIAPMRQIGSPSEPATQRLPYLAAAEQLAGSGAAHSTFKNASAMVSQPLPATAITTFITQMRAAPPGANLVGFFALGGAVAEVAPDATAFAHRNAIFDMQYQAYWQRGENGDAGIAWVNAIRAAMQPYASGAYVNYIDADLPDWATAFYGANLARLERVKARYDPENVFNGPQSIGG